MLGLVFLCVARGTSQLQMVCVEHQPKMSIRWYEDALYIYIKKKSCVKI